MILAVLIIQVGLIGLIGFFLIVSFYIIIVFFIRKKLLDINNLQKRNRDYAFDIVNASALGIRDIRVNAQEDKFLKAYIKNDWPLRKTGAKVNTFAGIPRITFETSILLIIALFVFLKGNEKSTTLLSELALVFIAIQRLVPIAQGFYGSIISINTNTYTIDGCLSVLNDLPQTNIISTKLKINSINHLLFL